MATIRYLVHNTEAARHFYTQHLGFQVIERWGPAFAIIARKGLTLCLSGPTTSAAQAMPDGRIPEPGGWNRIVVEVDNFESLVTILKHAGTHFRNEMVDGVGGNYLRADPADNPTELFEAKA